MLLARHMKTLSNHELSNKHDLLQKENSKAVHKAYVTDTAKPLVDLNQAHTKLTAKVKANDKALKIFMVLLFSIIGAVIFTKLLVRAIDIESEAQEYVLLEYKDDLNKKISFEAPQTDKE